MLKLSVALLTIPALGWMTDLAPTSAPWIPAPRSAQDPAPEKKPAPATKAVGDEIAALIAKLGSPDDAVRTQARDELAKRGEASRAGLEAAAKDSQDPEVRWNARKLLRRLEEAQAEPTPAKRLERHDVDGDRRPIGGLDELRELDTQENGAQEPGPSSARGSSKSVQIGPDGHVKVTVTEDVDGHRETKTYEADSMDELRRQHPGVLDEVRIGTGRGFSGFGPGVEGLQEELDRIRREFGADRSGVGGLHGFDDLRRTIERDLPRLFERENLGLDEQHLRPLREALKNLDGDLRGKSLRQDPGLEDERGLQQIPPPAAQPPATSPPASERLGVRVEVLHPEVASFLELEEGTGLLVAEVLDGTLAQSLGLRERDVLVSIQGEAVRTPESIRAALAKTPLDAKVRVEVLRFSSGRVTVEGKRPPSAREGGGGDADAPRALPPRSSEPKKLEGPSGGK